MGRVIAIAVLVCVSWSAVLAGPLEDCREYTTFGIPGTDGTFLCRKGYFLSHNTTTKTPLWVIERLTLRKLTGKATRSATRFKPDPDLPPGERAENADYARSGYDKGHMAPSDDMKWDQEAMQESFYLSNMVPQDPTMNRGIWKKLETRVRQWARVRGELFVYTGPIYSSDPDRIGRSEVAVPEKLFKVVFDPEAREGIAFVMPNRQTGQGDLGGYLTGIREVEKLTGLDFLSSLPQVEQEAIESRLPDALW